MAQTIVVFAGLYTEALRAYERGDRGRVPPAWQWAHDAARAHRVSKHELVMLAVNAHIRDLAVAIYRVERAEREHGVPSSRHDFLAVNEVIRDATGTARRRLASIYASGMHTVDFLGLDLDERFAQAFLLRRLPMLLRWLEGENTVWRVPSVSGYELPRKCDDVA